MLIHHIALIAIGRVYCLRRRAFLPLKIRQGLTLPEPKTKTRSLNPRCPAETDGAIATTRTAGLTDCNHRVCK